MTTQTVSFDRQVRETEKAILLRQQLSWCSSVGRSVEIWWPKSQVKVLNDHEIEAPSWLVSAKLAECRVSNITPWFEWV